MRILLVFIFLMISGPAIADQNKSLLEAAKDLTAKGDAEAAYNLGMFYNNGIGTDIDIPSAHAAFEQSAAAGHPLGAYKLGCYYAGQAGDHVTADPEKALKHKLVAAQAGYSLAQYDVGNHYAQKGDFSSAFPWWQKAAEQGYPSAILNLYRAYTYGWGVEEDPAAAHAYFKVSAIVGLGEIPPDVRATMDQLASALSPEQLERSTAIFIDFYHEPSELTKRAKSGIEYAKEYFKQMGYEIGGD